MTPFAFNLDSVMEITGTQGVSCCKCPYCESALHACLESNLLRCTGCKSVYDAVLFFDSVSKTNHIPTSLKQIVQQNCTTSKFNEKKTSTYLQTFTEFYKCFNDIQQAYLDSLAGNKWLRSHGDLLRSTDLYSSTSDSSRETMRACLTLCSEYKFPRKDMPIVSSGYPSACRSHHTVVVPTWAASGLSGLWFVTDDKQHLHMSTYKEAGLAFFHEARNYDTVLAVNDIRAALAIQYRYYNMYRKHAPVVAFSSLTSKEDWQLLRAVPNVVICGGLSLLGDRGAMSAAMCLPGVKYDLHLSNKTGADFNRLRASAELGKPLFEVLLALHAPRRSTFLDTLKTLDHQDFLEHCVKTHGVKACADLGLEVRQAPADIRTYNGHLLESTPEGYVVHTPGGRETITNFTVSIDKLLRYKDTDRTDYRCRVSIGGQALAVVLKRSDLVDRVADVINKTTTALVDSGSAVVPYINRKWAPGLHDVFLLFSNPNTEIVVEAPGYDEQSRCFRFSGATVGLDGTLIPTSDFVDTGVALTYYGSPDVSTTQSWNPDLKNFVSQLCTYTVYGLLASAGLPVGDVKPLILPTHGSGDAVLSAIWRSGVRGLELIRHRSGARNVFDKIANRPAMACLPPEYGLSLAAAGLAVYGQRPPYVLLSSDSKNVIRFFDSICVDFLSFVLYRQTESNLDALQSEFREYTRTHFGLAWETGLLPHDRVLEELSSRGGSLSAALTRWQKYA